MGVVKNDQADAYAKRPPRDLKFFLVHGNDEGLIHERAKVLVNSALEGEADPMRLVRMDGDALAREPGALADEAYAISMFGGSRAIWVEARSKDLSGLLEPLMARPPQDCKIVIEAGNLKKGAPLRSLFEKRSDAASVECYPDERKALLSVLEMEAQAANVSVSPEARDYLMGLLGADRLTSRGEIVKLMMYARGSERVELADVEAIVADAAPSGLDSVIDQALSGNIEATERGLGRYFADGGDAGGLMARLLARMVLLLNLRHEMDQGKALDQALQGQFFRPSPAARAALARQTEVWNSGALRRRLPALLASVGRVRRESRLGEVIAARFLWTLAWTARRGRA